MAHVKQLVPTLSKLIWTKFSGLQLRNKVSNFLFNCCARIRILICPCQNLHIDIDWSIQHCPKKSVWTKVNSTLSKKFAWTMVNPTLSNKFAWTMVNPTLSKKFAWTMVNPTLSKKLAWTMVNPTLSKKFAWTMVNPTLSKKFAWTMVNPILSKPLLGQWSIQHCLKIRLDNGQSNIVQKIRLDK